MTHENDSVNWPPEAGDPNALPRDMTPPAGLEDRVVERLRARRLLRAAPDAGRPLGWQVMRASLAAAACAALVAVGVLIGRATTVTAPVSVLSGAEADLYALLLYETPGYDRAEGAAARARFSEYSAWVAEARHRGQFVTGEDLEVMRGWVVRPDPAGVVVAPGTVVSGGAALSGLFFIRARDADQALELASTLPHVKHGGEVVVQKTIPTDTPPGQDE